MGRIEIIYGPMFSGKSSELIRKVKRYTHAKKNCLIINYYHDNRYSSEPTISTHDSITIKAHKIADLDQLDHIYSDYDVIAIDEAQFFQNIAHKADQLANMDKIVIVAGLDATFERKPFNQILELLPVAESVVKLSAVCVKCTGNASFTRRKVSSGQLELIGGQEMYEPVCRECFNQCQIQTQDRGIIQLDKPTIQCSQYQSLQVPQF